VRHIRMLTLCLMATFAVGALAASSSSAALPEWGKCVKLPAIIKGKEKKAGTGKFSNSNCTEGTTGGEFEFVKGTSDLNVEFENNMVSEKAELETASGLGVDCTGQKARGFLSGTKEVSNVTVTFTGCAVNVIPTFPCENTFAEQEGEEGFFKYKKGEIVTFELKGKLVYISGAGTSEPVVGLQLEPTAKKGWFAFLGCGPGGPQPLPAIKTVVGQKPFGPNSGDKVVSPISPLNTMGTETTQVYASKVHVNPETGETEERGVQNPNAINGKPAQLEADLFIESGSSAGEWGLSAQIETAITRLTSGEELEIKA
jgi:hypothetical protein